MANPNPKANILRPKNPAEAAAWILARDDFQWWCGMNGFKWAKHHKILGQHLQKVATGEIRRLAVLMPRGSAKSTYSSRLFPGFYLGQNPSHCIIAASHTQLLADKHGRAARNYVSGKGPCIGVDIAPDSQAASHWATVQGGEYLGIGVGGSVVGSRGDCLTGSTLVNTNYGLVRLADVDKLPGGVYIHSYDFAQHRPVYSRLAAVSRRKTDHIYRIRTASGDVVEATGNHRIYTSRGFIEASAINVGDVLLRSVPAELPQTAIRSSEESEAGDHLNVLQRELLDPCGEQRPWDEPVSTVQDVSHETPAKRKVVLRPVLLTEVPVRGQSSAGVSESDHKAQGLRGVRECFSTLLQSDSGAVLLHEVPERVAVRSDAGGWQQQLAGRHKQEPLFPGVATSVSAGPGFGNEDGWGKVCGVQLSAQPARAPHQRQPGGQPGRESGHTLQAMPLRLSWSGAGETAETTVAVVERVCCQETVYDLDIPETRCFFANGVLVHNCALLDDLIAGVEEADSDLFRDKVWEWLMFDLIPCLKPGSRMILVNNRWHEDDVAGRLFDPRNEHYNAEEAAKWTVLRMPLIAEDEDPLLGRKPGELLWPEYYNWDMVSDFKRDPRSFNAQYQQRPTSEEGGFFKREWLTGYTPSELPKDLRIYFASDHAVSTKQTADKTCLLVAGVCSQGYIWVLPETLWGRFTSEEVTEKAIDLIKLKNPLTWWAEKGHISQSIGPFLRRRMRERCIYTSIEEVTPAKDKQTRAQAIHGRMAMGMVRFPKFAPWWPDAEHELLSFPTGAHDDLCLAGNTRVRMADGTDSRLDQVKPGDFVATPFGPREVLAAEMTAPQADCLEVNFFDGRSLTGTHSHPILTENGFCRLDALACLDYCGCLYTLCKEAQAEQMLLNIEATDTAGIRIVSTRTIGATTTAPNPGEDSCTDMCGRTRTGRSPKGWTYTIRTAIQRTTTWEICRQFLDSITCFCTDLLSGPDQRHNSHILVESGKKPPSGTSRKLGASGTRPTENSRGLAGKSLWSPVWSAAKALRRFFRPGRSSVGRSVVTVPTVGVAFVRKARRQPVFNLRVDGHVFYANGILTHNCDALSWLGRGLETMVGPNGPVRRRDPGPKPFTGAWLNSIDERKRFKQMLEKSTAGW